MLRLCQIPRESENGYGPKKGHTLASRAHPRAGFFSSKSISCSVPSFDFIVLDFNITAHPFGQEVLSCSAEGMLRREHKDSQLLRMWEGMEGRREKNAGE